MRQAQPQWGNLVKRGQGVGRMLRGRGGGLRGGVPGTDGKDREGRSCCLGLVSSWRRRAESGPERIQTTLRLRRKFFTFLGSGGEEVVGGRHGGRGVNKRPQLLTVLLVFRSLPPTRSKEASAGGLTATGRRGC